MKKETIILIDENMHELQSIEEYIYEIDPGVQCISFVYADEAIEVICHHLKEIPRHIFIEGDVQRMSGGQCIESLRRNKALDDCQISIFSGLMPSAVADMYLRMGANFAFQKPINPGQIREKLSLILNSLEQVSLWVKG